MKIIVHLKTHVYRGAFAQAMCGSRPTPTAHQTEWSDKARIIDLSSHLAYLNDPNKFSRFLAIIYPENTEGGYG